MRTNKADEQLSLFMAEASQPGPGPTIQVLPETATTRTDVQSTHGDVVTPRCTGVRNSLAQEWHDSRENSGTFVRDCQGECEWSAFVRQHGRVPKIEDDKKPWEFRGWLLYYRLLLEDHLNVSRRWDYWCRTISAGRLLDEPIPQLTISNFGDSEVFKGVDQWVRLVDRYCSGWSAVEKLLDWFLWGFGQSRQEPQFPHELNESLYRQVNIGPMLLTPHDYLGEWIAVQKGNWNPNAFYPTPHTLVECIVQLTMGGMEDTHTKTVMDPCVGSGRMLMHASNYSLRLYGIDIDPTLVKVTYVNGGLYVPWILRPFPEVFFAEQNGGRNPQKS